MGDMTETQLEALIGPGAMRDYAKATKLEQYRIQAWVPSLPGLTDEAFLDLCTNVVSEGVQADSRRSREYEPDIKASACVHEAHRRHVAVGHSPTCEGDDLYMEGFNRARVRHGFKPGSSIACTCGLKK